MQKRALQAGMQATAASIAANLQIDDFSSVARSVAAHFRYPMTIRAASVLFLLLLLGPRVAAQNIQFTEGSIGTGLNNSITIPIRTYPGRGGTILPINLSYSSKVWRIKYLKTVRNYSGGLSYSLDPITSPQYGEYSTSGWRTSLDIPVIEWPESNLFTYKGETTHSIPITGTVYRMKRVYIHMPDGSSHEFRVSDLPYAATTTNTQYSGTFYAVDGSRMKYVGVNSNSGTLYLPDGSRYELDSGSANYVDRNGNKLIFNGSTRVWTDAFNRGISMPFPANPVAGTPTSYTVPGLAGSAGLTYTFVWEKLEDALTPVGGVTPSLKNWADYYLPAGGDPTDSNDRNFPTANTGDSLFQNFVDEGGHETWVTGPYDETSHLFNPVVLKEIDLPNGVKYQFSYNVYGELDKIVYPTGAYESEEYTQMAAMDTSGPYDQASRGVSQRNLSADGSSEIHWYYTTNIYGNVVTTISPVGTVTESYRYGSGGGGRAPFGLTDARDGAVYDTRVYELSGGVAGTMLRRELTDFSVSTYTIPYRPEYSSGAPGNDPVAATRNPRTAKTISLILDTGGDALAKSITYTYGADNEFTAGLDQTGSAEYGFASIGSSTAESGAIGLISDGSLLRTSETKYDLATNSGYLSSTRYLVGLPTESLVKDPSGNVVSRGRITYDDYSTHGLVTYSDLGTTTYDDPGSTSGSVTKRGNATSTRECLDLNSSCSTYLETQTQYDQTGNVVATFNERGIETNTEYGIHDGTGSTNFYFHVYPTKVTTAVPDSSGDHGSDEAFVTRTVYDPVTGLVKSTTDANGLTSTISYADDSGTLDTLLRPRKVTAPNGAWTKTFYHDSSSDLTSCATPGTTACIYTQTQTLMDTGRVTESYAFFDKLGRAIRSQSSLGSAGYLTVDTTYDAYGRAYSTSNPYTTSLGGTISTSVPKTLITGYDTLGRVTQVTFPDSTTVGTSYSGIYMTATDQAGRSRRQKMDALGRIVRVDEADPDPSHYGSLGSVDSPYMASYYTYDTLGHLIKIQQGQGTDLQYRYFKYDAIGRLIYEKQPEAAGTFPVTDALSGNNYWSRKLVYDQTIDSVSYKGLLTSMCDAREICAETEYDQLNRPWKVSYSGAHTPTITNYYDQAHTGYYNKGKLTQVDTASMSDSDPNDGYVNSIPVTSLKYDFDDMSRVVKSSQTVDSYVRGFDYVYNLGGQLTQEKYPSGRVVNLGYDDARRLSNVNSGSGHVYVDNFTYTGQGLVSGYTLGNGATVSLGYGTNGRLQLSEIVLAKNGATLQKYQYSYGQIESGTVNTAKNTGKLAQVDSWIGTIQEYRQQYFYDSVNRLIESKENFGTSLGTTAYDIKYRYDAFGNREQRSADNSGNATITQKWVESGDYDLNTNRYNTGVSYDAAGNITADPRFRNMLYDYDANGRQNYSAQANGSSPVTTIYDGAGRRVATKSSGYLSVMVYDAGGKLAAEYSQFAPPTTADVDYITSNYQGSTSVVTDHAGAVKSRHDYLPFGQEIGDGVGSRTTIKKFGQGDYVRQKYAGMETDDATGLNHTLWRKDDNWSGRWTSPDPYGGSMSSADPQSFNRYVYCDNDPVNHVDLSGLALSDIGVYQTDNPAVVDQLNWQQIRIFRYLTDPSFLQPSGGGGQPGAVARNHATRGGTPDIGGGTPPRTVALWFKHRRSGQAATFKRAADAVASPENVAAYTDGASLINALIELSKAGVISRIFIFGDGYSAGLIGQNPDNQSGFYSTVAKIGTLDPKARTTLNFANAVESGAIALAKDASIFLVACNTSFLASNLSYQLAHTRGAAYERVGVFGVSNNVKLSETNDRSWTIDSRSDGNNNFGHKTQNRGRVEKYAYGNPEAFFPFPEDTPTWDY